MDHNLRCLRTGNSWKYFRQDSVALFTRTVTKNPDGTTTDTFTRQPDMAVNAGTIFGISNDIKAVLSTAPTAGSP